MTWKHSDYYYLSNREMIEVGLLVLYFWESVKPTSLFTRMQYGSLTEQKAGSAKVIKLGM